MKSSLNATTDKDSTSLKEDSVLNQTQQPMTKIDEEDQLPDSEKDNETKQSIVESEIESSQQQQEPLHNRSIDREVQTIESAFMEMTMAKNKSDINAEDRIAEDEIAEDEIAEIENETSPYSKTMPNKTKQFREIQEAQKRMAIKNLMISKLEKQKVIRHQI